MRHILLTIVTLIMVLMLCLTGVTAVGAKGLLDRDLHERIAASDANVDLQLAEAHRSVRELAQELCFDAEPVVALITRESLVSLNEESILWWQGALRAKDELQAPEYLCPALKDTLAADSAFLAAGTCRPAEAAVAVCKAVTKTVIPVRAQLFSIGFGAVWKRLDLAGVLAWLPLLFVVPALTALLCVWLILLIAGRKPYGRSYVASGLFAGGALQLLVFALFGSLGITAQVAAVSPVLGAQLNVLAASLTPVLWISAAAELLVGAVLALTQRERKPA